METDHVNRGGGLVSTLSDLSVFIRGILDYTILDSKTKVQQWLKPSSATGSLNSLVGMPWEIYRTQELTPDHPHAVDIYAKAGAAYGYQSHMAIVEEYGAAVVVLTAGSPKAGNIIYDAVLSVLVPIFDQIARDQAITYTGMFVNNNTSDVSSNATVTQDKDSLVLTGLGRNGTDVLSSVGEILSIAVGGFLGLVPSQARIYPVGIERLGSLLLADGTNKTVIYEDWRIDWEFISDADSGLPGNGLSSRDCLTWTLSDWIHYGSEPLDRVVFVLDPDERQVLGIEVPFIRSGILEKSPGKK